MRPTSIKEILFSKATINTPTSKIFGTIIEIGPYGVLIEPSTSPTTFIPFTSISSIVCDGA